VLSKGKCYSNSVLLKKRVVLRRRRRRRRTSVFSAEGPTNKKKTGVTETSPSALSKIKPAKL
jgi:hypothetical protein